MRFREHGPSQPTINIAPLVDVVFLLVIFFAVSTTFLETSGLELTLPTSTSTTEVPPRQVTIVVTADSRFYVENEEVAESALAESLAGRLAEMERKLVVLRADTETPHGTVVRVMDLAREAGATDLNVAAQQKTD